MPDSSTATIETTDRTSGLNERIEAVKNLEVLVGIPADTATRDGDDMNNATLAFIHTYGSPIANIPARPFLIPGIKKAQELITKNLGKAALAIFEGNPEKATQFLNKAGQVASNSVKRIFTDPSNGWPPNSPLTIYLKGSDRPLIDTGQLRKSITYVVRETVSASAPQTKKEKVTYSRDGKSTLTSQTSERKD